MKNFVTFNADFPDDSEWTESGGLLVPEGREVADFISSALSRRGLDCSSPEQHSFYGWAFEVNTGTRFRCVLQFADPWLLICDSRVSLKDRLLGRRHHKEHKTVLDAINSVLQRDARFSAVKWFTREGYETSPEAGAG